MCAPICGDGLITGGEQCDDGNLSIGDGCSATCTVEPGFSCMGHPSACQHICGDGLIVIGEGCDDGNLDPDDGCSAACTQESGWACAGEPSVCAPVCGDGQVLGTESCDDGEANNTLGSCCTDTCNFQPSGTSCEDGNICTLDDVCDGENTCGGTPDTCDDENPCTTDSCDESSGCQNVNNSDPCDDGNACTTSDTCGGGSCNGGPALVCNDGNGCTDDSCNPASGCVYDNNTVRATTATRARRRTRAAAGTCNGGPALVCNDGNGCTDDSCNPASGLRVRQQHGLRATTATRARRADTCGGGTCNGGPALVCNDGNGCTDDSCNPASGCVYDNNTVPCDDGKRLHDRRHVRRRRLRERRSARVQRRQRLHRTTAATPRAVACTRTTRRRATTPTRARRATRAAAARATAGRRWCAATATAARTTAATPRAGACTRTTRRRVATATRVRRPTYAAPDVHERCRGVRVQRLPTAGRQPADLEYRQGGTDVPREMAAAAVLGRLRQQVERCPVQPAARSPGQLRHERACGRAGDRHAGASGLTYDTGSNQYHYNWKTSSTYLNKCYELLLELDNGTTQIARFKFNK
jgi:cysteine-rich repeat protein